MSSNPIKEVEKFVKDPGRVAAALVTGGLSEQVRFVEGEVKRAMTPDIPTPELAAAPPSPTSDDPAVQADLTAAQDAERKARGRASTMLTGGRGVSDQGLSLSRRTLLGS